MVGGKFSSTFGDEGRDDVVDTYVQDMDAVGMDEVTVSVNSNSHDDLLPSTGSKSILHLIQLIALDSWQCHIFRGIRCGS